MIAAKLPSAERLAQAAPVLWKWGAGAWNALASPLRLRHPGVAVEIAPESLKAARMNVSPQGERALAWARRDIEPDVVQVRLAEMEIPRPADLARHVARILENVGGSGEEVSVFFPSLAARAVTLEFDSFPSAPHEQMDMVQWKISPKIPYPPQDARVAYEPLPAPALGGDGKSRVFAVAVRRRAAEAVEEVFEAAGARVGFMQPTFIHFLTVAALAEPTLLVSASRAGVSLGVARGRGIALVREKDASGMGGDERREMFLREALATARYCEEHLGSPVAACRVADEAPPSFDAGRLSEALGAPVEDCPWPENLEPEPYLPPEERGAFAALAWAVAPRREKR